MKTTNILLTSIIAFSFFSCETTSEDPQDLVAPVIDHAESEDEISPDHGEVFTETMDHIPVSFSVEDPSGIGQIKVNVHANFDGHSHARVLNDFEKLAIDDIYAVDASDPDFQFQANSTLVNVNSTATDIYWSGSNSRLSGPVLAGIYDFSIAATDIYGNQTSFADASSYITTIHIRTAYAPSITVNNLDDDELLGSHGETLTVTGEISKPTDDLSAPLAFVWIKLGEEDDDDDHDHDHSERVSNDEHVYDKMWGSSQWLADGQGPDLPNDQLIDLATLLTGENAIILPATGEHLDLTIRAEDVNGNTTEKIFHVDID
ncbi:DUF4625 domain-containing protein [Cyclobacterium qasimii]|uniref:DUF4625 domain-containing protein n=2 Tax=Cyclobacterium qasimii TaxID=1350429 RepID=S7VN49_9BACT|nr:DUF4625 domain-containing protein [Cyclobacterium qasimii]EPR71620.1 hypothetical protein ADICYQ_0288 [Cyclobacterium qasimii M12-11B]GEO20319.1 hypothetical protein CQA01_08530 [Cyclobacterium qasimii]